MQVWEHMSEMDYSDRIGKPDPNNPDKLPDVFSFQNDTLGVAEGFVDFAAAQSLEDIFGTSPWLAATPVGRSDTELADQVTKHAQWKLDDSDLQATIEDAIHVACWGGTVFVKSRWVRDFETFEKTIQAAYSISTGEPFFNQAGDFIQSAEEIDALGIDGADVGWQEQNVEETTSIYDNSRNSCLDFRDVAFDSKAPDLNLAFTPFFSKFRMGLLDVVSRYRIPEGMREELRNAFVGANEEARVERGESNAGRTGEENEMDANPQISLVEGFLRCDPLGTGKPIRIHCVFSPELSIMFSMDYLANETPDGILPVFPVRIGKIPRRIFGIGYFKKYESSNNAVDRQHNAVTHRNKLASTIFTAIQPDALLDKDNREYLLDPSKPLVLDHDKLITDFIQFATMPDMNSRSVEIMNQQLQMMQMRSGITSAAQGELKGVPNASTATGVNQLTSRGALLLKMPINQITKDVRVIVQYNVNLLYANQDRDETFVWGEGEIAELHSIVAGDVRNLRMNVTLTLVQSQNQSKLANAQAAIGIMAQYAMIQETEKKSQRQLYVQAITSLGFNNAEDLVRMAITDPAGILALLPPEVAPIVQAALETAGLMTPGQEGAQPSAPVSPAA